MRWGREGLPPIRIGVNLSARQFRLGGLDRLVQAVLRDSGMPPQLLELELTESAMMHDAEETTGALAALKGLGVALSIDDFGTGYSSLAYLRRFPIDRVKIDRSFVRDLAEDPSAATLVQGVIGLAHGLRFRVVAEGVETGEQAQLLFGIMQDLRTRRTAGRREAHVHAHVRSVERHPVHQSKIHDVEADLGVLHAPQREPHQVLIQALRRWVFGVEFVGAPGGKGFVVHYSVNGKESIGMRLGRCPEE